jgi:hypothetical protein
MDKKYFLLFILIIVLHFPLQGQNYSPQQIELAERLQSLAKNAIPEIAYIQTSKDIYEIGEDLWFKVYLLDAHSLVPSLLSKTLYLQLLNESTKKAVWEEKYEIQNGFSYGRIFLAKTLPEGDYLLAAYTPNSFYNDTTEFKAVRRIKLKADIISVPFINAEFDKAFYNLNDSVRVKVALASAQTDSIPGEVTAIIKHENKKLRKIVVKTPINGNSIITFPLQNINEHLEVDLNVNHKERNELIKMVVPSKADPIQFDIFPEGGYLVSGIKSKIAFKAVNIKGEPLEVSGDLFEDNMPILEFKSQHAGMGSFVFKPETGKKYKIRLSEPSIDSTFFLPEMHPEGVVIQLTARDEKSLTLKVTQSPTLPPDVIYLRLQCRGIVYGMTSAELKNELLIKIPTEELPQGVYEITLYNGECHPVAERLVYINQDQKLNISASISEGIYPVRGKAILKITVKDKYGQPVVANLGISVFDRHYQNKSDSDNILSHIYLSEQLNGRIYNPSFYFDNDRKDSDGALDLLLLTQGWRKYTWCEDNLSKSTNNYQVITDGIEGVVTTRRKSDQKQSFVIVFSPNIDSTKVLIQADSVGVFSIPPKYFEKWKGEYIYMKPFSSLTVNIPIKLSDPFDIINSINRHNEFIYASPELIKERQQISKTDFVSNGVIRIKEVTIKGKKSNTIRGKYMGSLDSLARFSDSPDYVCRYNILNCKNHPHESDNKKPIEGKSYLVESGKGYIPIVYLASQRPKLSEKQLLRMYNLSRTKAYFNSREFYNPEYDKVKPENNLPDFRNTLLWEPSIFTNEKGEATLSFYCSDIYTDFVGRIEGVGGDGLLGSQYFKFTVRKLRLNP